MKRKKKKENLDEYFAQVEKTITTALNDPEILARLSEFGYDKAELEKGLGLCNNAKKAHEDYKEEILKPFKEN
ncbi:MAG: hypothetical protein KDD94_14585 [Calditrichaeota bacterium]|nr:hypothetical protein [Calditrichota bacterium]